MTYTVSVTVEGESQTQDVETKEEVKEALQMFNSLKSRGVVPEVTIVDEKGNELQPHDFGMPKPKKYESKMANAVDRVLSSEGDRASFEWLLETTAAGRFDSWDIQLALDEVFGGNYGDVPTMDKAVYDISDADKEKDKVTVIDNDFKIPEGKEGEVWDAVKDAGSESDDFLSAIKKKYKKKLNG